MVYQICSNLLIGLAVQSSFKLSEKNEQDKKVINWVEIREKMRERKCFNTYH